MEHYNTKLSIVEKVKVKSKSKVKAIPVTGRGGL
jgi:hypothetical protein